MTRSAAFTARVSGFVACFGGVALLVASYRLTWSEILFRCWGAESVARVTNITAEKYYLPRRWRSHRFYVQYTFQDRGGNVVETGHWVGRPEREALSVGGHAGVRYLPWAPSVSRLKSMNEDAAGVVVGFVVGPIFCLCGIGLGILGVMSILTGVDYVRRLKGEV